MNVVSADKAGITFKHIHYPTDPLANVYSPAPSPLASELVRACQTIHHLGIVLQRKNRKIKRLEAAVRSMNSQLRNQDWPVGH